MRPRALLCGAFLTGYSQADFSIEYQRPKVEYRRVNASTASTSSSAESITSPSSGPSTALPSSTTTSTSKHSILSSDPTASSTSKPPTSSLASSSSSSSSAAKSLPSLPHFSLAQTLNSLPTQRPSTGFSLSAKNGTCTRCTLDVLTRKTTVGPLFTHIPVTETVLNQTISYFTGEPPTLQTTNVTQVTLSRTTTLVVAGNQTISDSAPTFLIVPTPGVTLTRPAGTTYVILEGMQGGVESPSTRSPLSSGGPVDCRAKITPLEYAAPTRTEDWDYFIETITAEPSTTRGFQVDGGDKPFPRPLLDYLKQKHELRVDFGGHDIATCTSITVGGEGTNPIEGGIPPPIPSSVAPTPLPTNAISTYLSKTFEYTSTHLTVRGCLRCDEPGPTNKPLERVANPELPPEPVILPPAPATTIHIPPADQSPPVGNPIPIGDSVVNVHIGPTSPPIIPGVNGASPDVPPPPANQPPPNANDHLTPPKAPLPPDPLRNSNLKTPIIPNEPVQENPSPNNPSLPSGPAQPNAQPPVDPKDPTPRPPSVPNGPSQPAHSGPQTDLNRPNRQGQAGSQPEFNSPNQPAPPGPQTGFNPPDQLRPAPQTSLGSQANIPGNVVIGSQTLSIGQTTTINGATVIVPTSGGGSQLIVDGATHTIMPAPPAITEKPSISIGGNVVQASVIGGTPEFVLDASDTLTPGGVVTVSGTTFSMPASGAGSVVVANGATSTLSAAAPALTVGGPSKISASIKDGTTAFVVAPGQTLAAGSSVVVSGTTYSMPPTASGSILVVNGAASTLSGSSPAITIGGQLAISGSVKDGTTAFAIAPGQTLSPGAVVTVSGTTYSMPAAASGSVLIVNGATSTLSGPSPAITIGEQRAISGSVKDGTTAFTIAPGQTLTPGAVLTVSGTTYSMPATASGSVLVVNGASSTISAPTPVLTIGGGRSIISASVKDGTTAFVIAPGQTLAPGSAITLSGTTYSMPATASGSVLVVNGVSSTLAPPIPVMTLPNGVTVSASMKGGTTAFVVGNGQTLTPGGNVTVSGTIYSMSAAASGFDIVVYGQASTLSFNATTTGASATTTGPRSPGNTSGGGNKAVSSTPSAGGGSRLSTAGFNKWVENILLGLAGWALFLI